MSTTKTFWLPPPTKKTAVSSPDHVEDVNCLCIGTGRFLRSVLVPPLVASKVCKPAIIQTRGTNFIDFMADTDSNPAMGPEYPIDTVLQSGETETVYVKCFGAFSWGTDTHKQAVQEELLSKMKRYVISCCVVLFYYVICFP